MISLKFKRVLALALSVALLVGTMPTTISAQVAGGFQALAEVERLLYGNAGTGAIQPRLERVELDLFGKFKQVRSQFACRNRLVSFSPAIQDKSRFSCS